MPAIGQPADRAKIGSVYPEVLDHAASYSNLRPLGCLGGLFLSLEFLGAIGPSPVGVLRARSIGRLRPFGMLRTSVCARSTSQLARRTRHWRWRPVQSALST